MWGAFALSLPDRAPTLPDRALSWGGSRTTSQLQQVIGTVFSLSTRRIAAFNFHDLLHWPPDLPIVSSLEALVS
jgi:hypothetical protein